MDPETVLHALSAGIGSAGDRSRLCIFSVLGQKDEPLNLETAAGTAKYANHANTEILLPGNGFTFQVNHAFRPTRSLFAYFALFAV
jgi:hypothetical protein